MRCLCDRVASSSPFARKLWIKKGHPMCTVHAIGTHFFQNRTGMRDSSNVSRYTTPYILRLAQKEGLALTLAWRDQHSRY